MTGAPFRITVIIAPGFNIAATMTFLDPFRVANYLDGRLVFAWRLCSDTGGPIIASNGVEIHTDLLDPQGVGPDLAIVSTSWTPEALFGGPVEAALRRWARFGAVLGGLDTGAFVLGAAGLLDGYRAVTHYEHIDAMAEMFPDVEVTEDLYVIDRDRLTACGGLASGDLALQVLRTRLGDARTNAVARYVFHDRLRPEGARQLPEQAEPLGSTAPPALRRAIQVMEDNLEDVIAILEIARLARVSQRQLERLFRAMVGRSPRQYYSDIRLDRARGLVTQTEMSLREIAMASGFASSDHFSRAYRSRFGLPPGRDRRDGRVPFEFRAWPMHPRPTRRENGE